MTELDPGSALANAVTAASKAYRARDRAGVDRAYRGAIELADTTALAAELAVEHTSALLALNAVALADTRCAEHLSRFPGHLPLVAVRAQIRGARADHVGAGADAAAALPTATGAARSRLLRVQGLAAIAEHDFDLAAAKFTAARAGFRAAGHAAGLAAVDRDLVALAARQGDPATVDDILADPPRTTAEHLLHAALLRKRLRYEEALWVVRAAAEAPELDPALRLPVLGEQAVLLRLLRRDEEAERLTAEIAAAGPAADAVLARLRPDAVVPVTPRFERELRHARRLVEAGRFAEGEAVLGDLRNQATSDRDRSTWHLTAGGLELARHKALLRTHSDFVRRGPGEAVTHLAAAADLAGAPALTEVRALALAGLGDACFLSDAEDRAAAAWTAAYAADEAIAGSQVTDANRVRMLVAANTPYDRAIQATARAAEYDPRAVAAVVVAMEAARGATLLGAVLPGAPRDLPRLRDIEGTWRWLKSMTNDLADTQAVWLTHATADRVHHAVLGRGSVRLTSVAADVKGLTRAVSEFQSYLQPGALEMSAAAGDFDRALAAIGARVGLDEVLSTIPAGVDRLAVVASGPLAAIPWSGMSTTDGLLVGRYAISDLPCLAARRPLRVRAMRSRGDRDLVLSPPGGLTAAAPRPRRTVLAGHDATAAALGVHARAHRIIRIDCHGSHDPADPERSWLALGAGERLTAEEFARLSLRGTVTLGACESGMAQPRGRDEPVGFVRSALHAGAAAVLAARWVAADEAAAPLLDRFEHHLRHLPRDRALQRAQLELSTTDHPARWACWTLYGDPGPQTAAGPLRRLLRGRADRRRHHAPHR